MTKAKVAGNCPNNFGVVYDLSSVKRLSLLFTVLTAITDSDDFIQICDAQTTHCLREYVACTLSIPLYPGHSFE